MGQIGKIPSMIGGYEVAENQYQAMYFERYRIPYIWVEVASKWVFLRHLYVTRLRFRAAGGEQIEEYEDMS